MLRSLITFRRFITSLFLFSLGIINPNPFVRASSLESNQCEQSYEDVIFINTPEDLYNIDNCTTLNSSLFINGDYNLDSLSALENLILLKVTLF